MKIIVSYERLDYEDTSDMSTVQEYLDILHKMQCRFI
jgi:hypothetical protein